jgi:glutamate carboxypeptidase
MSRSVDDASRLSDALAWLDAQSDAIGPTLQTWANIGSGSYHVDGLHRMADTLQSYGDALLRIPSHRQPLSPWQRIDPQGNWQSQATGDALCWHTNRLASRRVLLGIHYDTVYGPDQPFQTCQWLDDHRLRGPGVADAKGGILVMLHAAAAIERFAVAPHLQLTVAITPDEEIGSPASTPRWNQWAKEHDWGLLFEPALVTGQLIDRRKGSGNFSLVIHGRSSHAGRHPEQGRNAIVLAAHCIQQLDRLNDHANGISINVARVDGGGPSNVVPDLAIVRFNARAQHAQQAHQLQQAFDSLASQWSATEGYRVQLHGSFTAPPKPRDQAADAIIARLEQAAARLNQPPLQWTHSGGVSDGNRLAAAGLPNIDTLGPIGDRIHSSDEWVDIRSIIPKAKLVVQALAIESDDCMV